MLRWTPIGGTPSTVARRSRFALRTRFCIFFKTTGPVLIHHVDRGDTIDHRYYINPLAPGDVYIRPNAVVE